MSTRAAAGLLVAGGLASTLIYVLAFAARYPLPSLYRQPFLTLRSGTSGSHPILLAAAWIALFAIYYACYRLCPRGRSMGLAALVAGFSVLFAGALLWMYPVGSSDLYEYVARAQMVLVHGVSPFTTPASAFPGDPWNRFVYWKSEPDNYGVLWQLLNLLVAHTFPAALLTRLLATKLLVIVFFWAGMPLVYATLARLDPGHALRGLLLYSWSPLLLFEIAGNGHNDALVVFWLLLAAFWLVRGSYIPALTSLFLGMLVKFVPVLLVPLVVVLLARDRSKSRAQKAAILVLAASAGLAIAFLLYGIFGWASPLQSLKALGGRSGLFANSLSAAAVWVASTRLAFSQVAALRVATLLGALVIVDVLAILCLRRFRRGQTTDPGGAAQLAAGDYLSGGFELFFVLLLLGLTWLWPWYLAWLMAFAPLLARRGYAARATVFTGCAVVIYFMYDYAAAWLVTRQDDQTVLSLATAAFTFVPAAALSMWLWLRPGRARPARAAVAAVRSSPSRELPATSPQR